MPFWPLQGYLIRFCVHLHRHLFFVATNLTWCHTRFNDSLNCATSPIGNFLFAFCSIISIVSHGSAAAIRHHLASGIYNVILFIRLFLLPVLVYVKRLPVKESVSHTCAVAGGVPSLFPFFYIWNKTLYSLYSHFLLFYVFLFRGAFFWRHKTCIRKSIEQWRSLFSFFKDGLPHFSFVLRLLSHFLGCLILRIFIVGSLESTATVVSVRWVSLVVVLINFFPLFFLCPFWQILWTAMSLAMGLEIRGDIIRGLPCIKRLNQLFCPTAGNRYPG